MKLRHSIAIALLVIIPQFAVAEAPPQAPTAPPAAPVVTSAPKPPPADKDATKAAFIVAAGAMSIFLAVAFVMTLARLGADKAWKLSDALSEESPQAQGTPPRLVASSSRLIAFVGMLALIGLTVGAAYCMLWAFISGQSLDPLDKIGSFLTSAAIVFVPYVANQLKAAVKGP